MQILLATLNSKYIHTNLAIRILYQLNKEHKGLAWKEFTINEEQEPIVEFCSHFDIVCLSCYIWNITPTLAVAKLLKERNPNIKILLGGPEVSYEYGDIINLPEIDYIISGEGEIPFQQFIQSYPNIEHVEGLIYKKENNIIENKNVSVFDLENYNHFMPYTDDDSTSLASKVLYIETSRGCPYKCGFCLASLDNKVRNLPNAAIKNMLLFMIEHGRTIKFLDRTFNIKKDFTIDIFQFILDNHKPNVVYQFEITADIIHPDIIQFIEEKVPYGIFRFEIGIQTVNQKANLEVKRKQNFEKTKSIIQQLDHKIEMHLDLIVGLALDYFDDIKYSFEEVFKLYAPELQLGFLKFLKGTPVRDTYQQHGFVFDKNPPYQIIQSNYLSKEELHNIVLLEHALEVYWNKKRAINTLKYVTEHYSIFDFLLGLGTYFATVSDLHRYTLKNIYEFLYQYANQHFAEDIILKEFIAIDYYLHHKIKPQQLFIEEISSQQKQEILNQQQLNTHKFRYTVLDLHFDYDIFKNENKIEFTPYTLILKYVASEKAIHISTSKICSNKFVQV